MVDNVVIGTVQSNGEIVTYISDGIYDNDLVYVIQTLKDRRNARVRAING